MEKSEKPDNKETDDIEEFINSFSELVDLEYPYKHGFASIVLFGDKGTGKTMTAFSFPGNILAIGLESANNLTMPHEVFFSRTKRIQIKNLDPFIDESTPERFLETANRAFEILVQLLQNAKKQQFDWIILDGLQKLVKICEMRMRFVKDLGFVEGFKQLTIWNMRTLYINQIYKELVAAAKHGVIFTSQNVYQEARFGDEKGVKKEPAWKARIMEDTTTVVYMMREEMNLGNDKKLEFTAYVDSCKLSGFTGKLNLTLDGKHSPKLLAETILKRKPEFVVE